MQGLSRDSQTSSHVQHLLNASKLHANADCNLTASCLLSMQRAQQFLALGVHEAHEVGTSKTYGIRVGDAFLVNSGIKEPSTP